MRKLLVFMVTGLLGISTCLFGSTVGIHAMEMEELIVVENDKDEEIKESLMEIEPDSDDVDTSDSLTNDGTDISSYLTVDNNGIITKYSGTDIADIIIPSQVDGKTIIGIGNEVFKNHTEIASVDFPNTLKSIGDYAFEYAGMGTKNQTGSLRIPASVDSIGHHAFYQCPYLGSVEFEDYTGTGAPAAVNFPLSLIGESCAFVKCEKLTEIRLSNRIPEIPAYFASDNSSLETVVWPSELTKIGDNAFSGDTKLTSNDLSQTKLKSIGSSAFKSCSSLPAVVFPESTLTTIGDYAFEYTGMGTKTQTGSIRIPASVDSIGHHAFYQCPYLGSVEFEDYTGTGAPAAVNFPLSLTGESCAFVKCEKLTEIRLSNRILEIPAYFASDNSSLETVVWPSELTKIGDNAFSGDTKLTSNDLSQTKLKSIGSSAFKSCSSLPAVVFPENTLTSIEDYAFGYAGMGTKTQTGSIRIPVSVDSIGHHAFYQCQYLGSVEFEDYTGTGAPAAVNFPLSLTGESCAFVKCEKLIEIRLSNRILEIPAYFASDNSSLETVVWPSELTKIGDNAFSGDTKLTSNDLSQTKLKSIGSSAFKSCSSLPAVVFPENTLTSIEDYAFGYAGMGTKTQTGSIRIPVSVDSIGHHAFYQCQYLGSVEFEDYTGTGTPAAVNFPFSLIGESCAFVKCEKLTEIRLSNRILEIPAYFASDNSSLETVVWPSELTKIGDNAFSEDTKLTSNDLSATRIETIGENAFYGCSSLPAVGLPESTLTSIGAYAFEYAGMGIPANAGTVLIPSNVEKVGRGAFKGCPYLGSIVIGPDNGYLDGMSLGDELLRDCPMLTEIELSDRIQTIPSEFAYGCPTLSHVVIPSKTKSIGNRAFYVSKLTDIVVTSTNDVVKNYNWAGDNRNLVEAAITGIKLNKDSLTLNPGESRTLEVYVTTYPENAFTPVIKWTSSNEGIATVKSGVVTGVSAGEAIITASTLDDKYSASCAVTVTDTYVKKTDTMVIGQKINLRQACFADITDTISRYIVNDKTLASVSKEILSGKKPGKVTVYAQKMVSRNNYENIADCEVTILNKPQLKFTKNMTYVGQTVDGDDFFKTDDIKAFGATYWESNKPGIIEVTDSNNGILQAKGSGTAKITAYFGEKGKPGTFKISANLYVKVPSFAKTDYSLQTGAKLTISMKNVTGALDPGWVTAEERIAHASAQLNNKGVKTGKVIIEGLNYGDTQLTATIDGQKYHCTIHVTAPEINKSAMTLSVGKTGTVSLKKTKIKKTDVQWISDDPEIASVDANGKITAKKSGSTVIYTETGGKRNECHVTVR